MHVQPEELREWLNKLLESDKHIIVEGKRDNAALIALGVAEERITELRKALFEHVEDIAAAHKDVIIFTDLDKEGRELYAKLKHDLLRHGVRVDTYFREFLFGTRLTHIEGLATFLRNILE